jgi:transposase InsO family protein
MNRLLTPAILDACSRKVMGYAISRHIYTQLALAALDAAFASKHLSDTCIHHSDRGSQYASDEYRRALKKLRLSGSMSAWAIFLHGHVHAVKPRREDLDRYQEGVRRRAASECCKPLLRAVEGFFLIEGENANQ